MQSIWTAQLREYYATRISDKAAPNTVGWVISTLSAIFEVLRDNELVTENPCELVRGNARGLKLASHPRQRYLSWDTVNLIIDAYNKRTKGTVCPRWLRPVILTSYYSGMRLGAILELNCSMVFLSKRVIFLAATDPKEKRPKKVPIYRDLLPVLEQALQVRSMEHDDVFHLVDRRGTRPIQKDCVKLAMGRISSALNPNPRWRFYDFRHTFKSNCSRSGIPDRMSERIMGHSDKSGNLDGHLSVSRRYG